MRSANGKEVAELDELVTELTGRVADLSRGVELADVVRGNALEQGVDETARGEDDSSDPIEFITENGFSIVRPWESGNSPQPTAARCRFAVSDGFIEREVTVEISPRINAEVELRTRGKIELSNSFWICCAERHLSNYVSEHADFPEDDKLIVEELDSEDILSALRWEKSG